MRVLTIPNVLTIFRLILVPFVCYNIIFSNFNKALILIIIAVITDGLDGFIARKFNQTSALGKIIDPIADKTLVIMGIIGLYLSEPPKISVFLLLIIIFREVYILAGTSYLLVFVKNFQIKPTVIGKFTAFTQFLMLISIIAENVFQWLNGFAHFTKILVVIFVIISVLQYSYIGFSYIGRGHGDL